MKYKNEAAAILSNQLHTSTYDVCSYTGDFYKWNV